MATKYYRKYLEEGRCTMCGGYLPEGYRNKECDHCRELKKVRRKRKKAEADARKEAGKKAAEKPGYTLDELSRMARERGISYGQLVCELDGSRSGAEKDKMSGM